MRVVRLVKWSVLLLILALLITVGVLYYLISRVPEDYRPAELTYQQRRTVAEATFWEDVSRLNDIVHDGQRDQFRLSQRRLNEYLASMDEIAVLQQGTDPGEVHGKMEQLGLAGPAVSLQEGRLVFMILSTEYGKVVSVDLLPEVRDGQFSVRLLDVRIGNLSLPAGPVRSQLDRLLSALPEPPGDSGRKPSENLVAMLRTVIGSAAGAGAVPAKFKWDRRQVHLRRVDVEDGALVLWLEPER
jgi:hypothetical protein